MGLVHRMLAQTIETPKELVFYTVSAYKLCFFLETGSMAMYTDSLKTFKLMYHGVIEY